MGLGNIHQINFTPSNYDAGGRFRMSQITELGEYKIFNGNANTDLLATTGSATFAFSGSGNLNKYNMSVTSGQYGIIYSKKYHPYLNGKSQLIEMTVANFGAAANVNKSIGYISSDATAPFNTGLDGFRLIKDTSDVYSIEVWRNGTRIIQSLQSNWTLDKLDGTGASGHNINTNNFQFFAFDFLYLGGTALRCFTFVNGSLVLFNIIPWAGSANVDNSPIFNSPNKPIRYEIRSTTGTGNMDFICSLVASEGQVGMPDQQRIIQGATAGITAAVAGTSYALCGVRKSATFRDVYAYIKKIEAAITSNSAGDIILLELRVNPTIAGVVNWAAVSGTPLESFSGAATNTVTGGTILNSTYVSLNMNNALTLESVSTELNSTLGNVMDTMILCATPALGKSNILVTGGILASWLNA